MKKKNGIPYVGKEVDNSKQLAPGQGHIGMTKPSRAGMIFIKDREASFLSNKKVMFYPETISLRKEKGKIGYMIDVVYFDHATTTYTIELNMLVLSKYQVKELRQFNSEAMTLYSDVNRLAGSGNYCMTKPSSIACDLDIRECLYKPNQLVRYEPHSIKQETDGDKINFYDISVAYVNISPEVVDVQLDKLNLSDSQLAKIREVNPDAANWYKRKTGKLSKQCACVKGELVAEEEDE